MTALLLLSGIFIYTVTSEQTEIVKLVDLFFTPSSEKIIYPGIDGGDNGKDINRVTFLSIREYKKLEKEVKLLRKENEELQDLLEGIFSNEKIIAKKKMEEYNGKKCGGAVFEKFCLQ